MESSDVLVEVAESVVLEINHIEDPMGSGGCPLIDRQQHVLLVSDDLVEVGVVEPEVLLLVASIGCLEEVQYLQLSCNFKHYLYMVKSPYNCLSNGVRITGIE